MQKRIQRAIEQAGAAAGKPGAWSVFLILLLGALMLFGVLRTAFFGSLGAEQHIWAELSLLLLIAVVAERLVQQWKQPFVMVLLLLGVVISPYTLAAVWPPIAQALAPVLQPYGLHPNPQDIPNLVSSNELIRTFANFGVIILLFRIGLHSKLEQVFNLKNLAVATGGVILPFVAGFLYAQSTGGDFTYSLFIGAALTATSVGITVAVLEEMGLMAKPFAQTILGAAVIDDILALMVLGLIRNIPAGVDAAVLGSLAYPLAVAIVFVVSGLTLGRLFINRFFDQQEKEISKRTLAGLLAILFFYAFAAESLGLSAIVGAFLAGLVIASSALADKLNHALFPLDVLFTPIFFISLGMLVDVWAIPGILMPVLTLTAIAVVTKMIGCGIPAKLFGMSAAESLQVGFGMVPRGEIALIIALLGLSTLKADGSPILTTAQYTLIASMAFLTTVIVPVGLKWLVEKNETRG